VAVDFATTILLHLLWKLLSEEGSIWITIDDTECHYLKILCDELFGRYNFVSSIAWEKDQGRRGDTDISSAHDHILLYARYRDVWRKTRNLLSRSVEQESRYRNPDNDPRGLWLQGDNGTAKSGSENARFPIKLPSGREVVPPKGNYWRFSRENFEQARAEGRVHFGVKGDNMPVIKRYITEVQQGVVPRTWWSAEEAGSNQDAKRDHLRKLLPEIEPFATPKPEQLLQQMFLISTNPLLEKDKWGNWVISKAYNPAMLAQAVCKLEGFIYAPSDTVYWQQGHSTERDFIYVTTQNLSHDQLQALSDEVGEGRSLLVMCSAFWGKPDKYPNLTIKKIPKTVLSRCEWGRPTLLLDSQATRVRG
jgi:hypothetical protein